jgi:hypothetical protein
LDSLKKLRASTRFREYRRMRQREETFMRYKFALALPAAAALFVIAPFATRPALAQPTTITACQTISQPGSYVLTTNISAPINGNCLVITTGPVTVDLQGFTIFGRSSGGARGREYWAPVLSATAQS